MADCSENKKIDKVIVNIFKFGGSCFKDKDSFELSLKIVDRYKENPLIIVCSALQGITDKLIEFGNTVKEMGSLDKKAENVLKEIKMKHLETIDNIFTGTNTLKNELHKFIELNIEKIVLYVPHLINFGMTSKYSDFIVAFGERISTYLYTQYLKYKHYNSEFVPPDESFIITDDTFGNALPLLDICEKNISEKLHKLLTQNKILIIPGFYSSTKNGEITTLGRGGSDFTATIIAYSLTKKYSPCVIFWKDVYGILSTNPKYVPKAKLLKQISYAEAKELVYFGSKILHPKCLKMAENKDIPTEIRCYTDPFSENYTQITKECIIPNKAHEFIKGITSIDPIAMVTVQSDAMISLPGSAAKIFSLMGQNKINIIFISQSSSENNITFGTSPENGFKAGQVLAQNEFFGKDWFNVRVEHDAALISVIGAGMVHKPGVAGLLFTALGNANVNIRAIAQGSSETNITLIISKDDVETALNTIYDTFINGTALN